MDAVDESLCSQRDCCDGESRGEQAGPHAAKRISAGHSRVTGEEAGERKYREEPAAEEPLLRGHVDEEEKRRRNEQGGESALADDH